MPTLASAKHERFAQALADGQGVGEAYESAGYAANRGNAARLNAQESIRGRVSELLAERQAAITGASAQAIEAAGLTKQWVIDGLIKNATAAATAEDFAPSNRALELLGKELGMFIDRKEVGAPGEFAGLNADDRKHVRDAIREELARRTGAAGADGRGEPAGAVPAIH